VLTRYENEYASSAYLKKLTNGEISEDIHSEKITDPFLQDIIRQKHTQNTLTDIIESIQENQNDIISHDENDNIVVQGCAGSGKTMILLHRLSFIKYRNRSLDLSKIKILTPNALFSVYINDLSESLELDKIERLTVNEYYAELLTRYYGIERMQMKKKSTPGQLLDFKAALLAGEKAASGWPGVYSEIVWDFIGAETAHFMRDILERDINVGALNAILNNRFDGDAGIGPDIRKIANLDAVLADIKESLSPYYKRLSSVLESETAFTAAEQEFLKMKSAITDADALLDKLTQETLSEKNNLRLTYEENRRTLSERLQQLRSELKRTPDGPRSRQLKARIAVLLNELCVCEFCLSALKYRRLRRVLDIDIKHLREEETRLPFSDDDMVLIENAYRHTHNFSVEKIEKDIFAALKLEYGNHLSFRNAIYVRLLIRFFLFGPLSGSEKLLCIDEAHDLSLGEYRLFTAVCDNPRFNIYGDTNQLITSGEGVSDWAGLKGIFGFTQFTLNENYRNSAEIVDYCNKTLGFETTNLGVGGEPVRTLDFDGLVRHLNNNILGTRKICVIVKKKTPSVVTKLRDRLGAPLSLTDIRPGEISLLTPAEAKGLEFDSCYVLTEGMNRNEKYISYTRALNELYIVSK
jgi:hypothetical protein